MRHSLKREALWPPILFMKRFYEYVAVRQAQLEQFKIENTHNFQTSLLHSQK